MDRCDGGSLRRRDASKSSVYDEFLRHGTELERGRHAAGLTFEYGVFSGYTLIGCTREQAIMVNYLCYGMNYN